MPIVCIDILLLSYLQHGLLEGFTEFLGNISRILIGNIYDRTKKKNRLFLVSSILNILLLICVKMLSSPFIILSKVFERVSNGTFAVQRDAYIVSKSKKQSMPLALSVSVKAVGISAGTAIVSYVSNNQVLNIASISNIVNLLMVFSGIALILILFLVKQENVINKKTETFKIIDIGNVITKCYPILLLAFLYFLSRFNDGVIVNFLRIMEYPAWYYTSTIGIFNLTMIFASLIIGKLAEKYINFCILLTGISMLFFNVIFFNLDKNNLIIASIGLLFWGLQRCSAQIVFESLLVKFVEKKWYGTAIGTYYVVIGIAGLIASSVTGHLVTQNYLQAFLYSGGVSVYFLLASLFFIRSAKRKERNVKYLGS
jgi:predicted MFS family arabinose efflux permease